MRKTRIILAAVFIIGITLLMVGIGQQWWGWMAKLQFLPSCLALNVGVIVGITLLTFVFGRIYCSVSCPLGVFQDLVNFLSTKAHRKPRFSFHKELKWVRYIFLAALIAAMAAGVQVFIAIIAPYSAYGRMVSTAVRLFSGASLGAGLAVTAILTFVLLAVCAWIWGRDYCNTVCPVGTVLSLFSRFALLRPVIDNDKCVGCRSCEKKCKASCIDSFNHSIDYSRCVDCFDCIEDCKVGAIKYRFAYGKKKDATLPQDGKPADSGRRAFIATAAVIGGAAVAKAQEKVNTLAPVTPKQLPQRESLTVPFGAVSRDNFYDHCTACQLCIQNCPNGVLRTSTDGKHFLQPEMGFEKGYCRPECNICSQVCPTGAILPVKPEEKLGIRIGTAVVDLDLCVVNRDNVSCGNCERHCPTGAIRMVRRDISDPESLRIPTVAENVCIGCGACENLCPSRPVSAIHVEGLSTHIIK